MGVGEMASEEPEVVCGIEGRMGGELRKEFLRMPVGVSAEGKEVGKG